mmetsp:Transcript_105814/g.215777  ORF Transcript_105814/g.215777 Transcript_105814/m.215777 type:complete len:228 (+) Transcript_105814:1006-1689(+)
MLACFCLYARRPSPSHSFVAAVYSRVRSNQQFDLVRNVHEPFFRRQQKKPRTQFSQFRFCVLHVVCLDVAKGPGIIVSVLRQALHDVFLVVFGHRTLLLVLTHFVRVGDVEELDDADAHHGLFVVLPRRRIGVPHVVVGVSYETDRGKVGREGLRRVPVRGNNGVLDFFEEVRIPSFEVAFALYFRLSDPSRSTTFVSSVLDHGGFFGIWVGGATGTSASWCQWVVV